MKQHYIKAGIVDNYSGSQNKQAVIVGFHLERWLKRALTALNVPFFDNCCDQGSDTQPARYNQDTGTLEAYDGTEWVEVVLTGNPQLATPTSFAGTVASGQSVLTWNTVVNATSYQVKKNGVTIATVTSPTYTATGLTNGTTYTFTVVAKASGYPTSAAATTTVTPSNVVPNTAPVASGVGIIGTPAIGEELSAIYAYTDADSDLEGSSTIQWYRANTTDGTSDFAIPGATSANYTVDSDDLGFYIRFEVTPVALTGVTPGILVESAYTTIVIDAPPQVLTMTATDATHITVLFNEPVVGTIAGFSVSDGAPVAIASVSGSGTNTWIFTLSDTMISASAITMSYDSGPGDAADSALNALASFTGVAVTNSITNIIEFLMNVVADPYPGLTTSDSNTYTNTVPYNATSTQLDVHTHNPGDYLIIRFPEGLTDFDFWDETGTLNSNVAIPGVQFPHKFVANGYNYITSTSATFSSNPAARVVLHN